MAGPFLARSRIFVFIPVFVVICVLIFSAASPEHGTKAIHKIQETAHSAADNIWSLDRAFKGKASLSNSLHTLYKPILHPITSRSYTDANGKWFETKEDADAPWWDKPLGKNVLIVDIDTRVPNGSNEIWGDTRLNWERMSEKGDNGMVSASFMNHYLYSQIHGYDYRFFNAHEMKGLHGTWIKPHAILQLLHSYRFVVFVDGDATIQHLEIPIEWLFNRWGVTPQTSIAMPLDVRFTNNGNKHASEDSKGKLAQNTGLIIAQALPHTFAMLEAWAQCPSEVRYPGCGAWNETWAHEQRAFAEYIRYDFNPSGNNIVEIPCNDAVGYPGLVDIKWVQSNCTGQFVRHHTIDKEMTKRSSEIAMLQGLADLAHMSLLKGKKTYWMEEL